VTAGDWAALVIAVAGLIVGLSGLPRDARHRPATFVASGFLALLAVTIGVLANLNPDGTAVAQPGGGSTAAPVAPTSVTAPPPTASSVGTQPTTATPGTYARTAAVTYLEELDAISGSWPYNQTISIRGTPYAHSLAHYNCGHHPNVIEYDLGGKYRRFHAIAGMSDRTASGAISEFEFSVDDGPVERVRVTRGDATPVDLDLTGGLTLKIIVTSIVEGCGDGGITLGEARLEA